MSDRLLLFRRITACVLAISCVSTGSPGTARTGVGAFSLGEFSIPRATAPLPRALWRKVAGTQGAAAVDADPAKVRRLAVHREDTGHGSLLDIPAMRAAHYVVPDKAPLDPHAMRQGAAGTSSSHVSRPQIVMGQPQRVGTGTQLRGFGSQVVRPKSNTVNLGASNYSAFTGFNHWWTFEDDDVPGVGHYFANIGTGQNLILQADDMDIAHKGIDLAFRRTYNSQSLHDVNNDDGSDWFGQFGNGWTATFDAHLATNTGNANGLGISVFDIDGARYDYLSDGAGHWIPPAGMHYPLTYDGSLGYYWTKSSGTVYHFYPPSALINCPNSSYAPDCGVTGRLYAILGRNNNNTLSFLYYFDGNNFSTASYLNEIQVVAESGLTATLNFANFGTYRLASKLTWPDGTTVGYSYDASGDLIEVDEPVNSQSSTACVAVSPCLPQQYGYTGQHLLNFVSDPRWVVSHSSGYTGAADGQYVQFSYYSWNGFEEADYIGVVNPQISDGYSSGPIQTGYPSGAYQSHSARFDYVGVGSGGSPVTWEWHDSDLHQTTYSFNAPTGSVIERQAWTGSTTLTTTSGWDASNNLLFDTDARGNRTDYAYDANGNATVMAEPQVTTSVGTFRPTAYYSYDANNNVLAYCDQVWSNANGRNWSSTPADPTTDTLCPSRLGATTYAWSDQTGNGMEPFGELTSSASPLGFTTTFQYSASSQGGKDYGLPTAVIGQSFIQADNTSSTPTQTFTYDAQGNLLTYNKGNGAWTLTYDGSDRRISAADPDGPSTCSWYFPDGTLRAKETPAERGYHTMLQCNPASAPDSQAAAYTYDLDGNETSETAHHGCVSPSPCTAGLTQKWYDGRGRLVEVSQPHDSSDFYTTPWITRYLYDLSQGVGSVSYQGTSFQAFGNLFETQELLPGLMATWTELQPTATGTPSFLPTKADAFDALDRTIAHYEYLPSTSTVVSHSYVFDASGNLGLLSSDCNEVAQCQVYTYDAREKMSSITFSGSDAATSRSYTYDPDARVVAIATGSMGTQQYAFDADGRLTSSIEPTFSGFKSPATLSYQYYPSGKREYLSVSSSALSASPLIAYSYRADQAVQTETVTGAGANFTVNPSYSAAGRFTQRHESGTGVTTQNGVVQQYDLFGRPTITTSPDGTVSLTSFDLEGAPVGGTAPLAPGQGTGNRTLATTYTIRGESAKSIWGCSSKGPCANAVFANAATINSTRSTGSYKLASSMIDTARSGLVQTSPPTTCVNGAGQCPTTEQPTINTYDNAHRMNGSGGPSLQYSTSYDNENHITNETLVGAAGSIGQCQYTELAYIWGQNGHPLEIGGTSDLNSIKGCGAKGVLAPMQYESLHWDGGVLLFTTNASGVLDDIKLDSTADYVPPNGKNYSGATFLDRASDGTLFSCHNINGFGGVTFVAYQLSTCSLPGGVSSPLYASGNGYTNVVGLGGLLIQPRPEAYSDGYNAIQGTRIYDSNLGSFTTPDAFAGDVHDPMSQKPYVWNRNNPYEYSDPSGFIGEGILVDVGLDLTEAFAARFLSATAAGAVATFHQQLNGPGFLDQTLDAAQKKNAENNQDKDATQPDRAGKPFTRKDKETVRGDNAAANGGTMTCEKCGQEVVQPKQHQKGVTPPGNEAHVDHIDPKANGGAGSPENGQVLCRTCNLVKGATPP